MRSLIVVLTFSLALAAGVSAATLETHARVELITQAEASLAGWNDQTTPTWELTGKPGDQIQVSLERRTFDGRRLTVGLDQSVSLDEHGQILTTLTPPAVDPHEPPTVLTLVVCHE